MGKFKFKRTIIILTVLAVVLAAVYFAFLRQNDVCGCEEDMDAQDPMKQIEALMKEHENISFDEGDGIVFVNNEVILIVKAGVEAEAVEDLADEYSAEIVDAMEEAGIYQLQLKKARELSKLRKLVKNLKQEDIVSDAYLNPVALVEQDDTDQTIEIADPIYPDDPWKKADWDMDVPSDENWSMEAIHAPSAWGYLEELETVKIGLIDTMPDMTHEDLEVEDAFLSLFDTDSGEWETESVDNGDLEAHKHGTHVAGIMAATWNDVGVSGMMGDKAELYYSCAYNVRDGKIEGGYYTAYSYIKAISVLLEQDVQAINISQNTSRLIGFAASHGNAKAQEYLQAQANIAQAALKRIIETRKAQGKPDFVICVSAGNSNNITFYPNEKAPYGYSEKPGFFQLFSGGEKGGSEAKYNNFLALMDDEDVASRVIVVGAVGIDEANSNKSQTRYTYACFSNIGARVDIAAPGVDVYSTVVGKYAELSGTSMSAPHVTAAAAMAFAGNEKLSGPEVKKLVCASTSGRYVYEDGSCGMLDFGLLMSRSIATVESSVNRVIAGSSSGGLELCFVVDTTGSMGDEINNAKENMLEILESIAAKTDDYRVALVDYRDFPERTGDYEDYASKLQLPLTSDHDAIVEAINGLSLGYGGDGPETVYSGIAEALKLDWRTGVTKVIIILGDAEPLDAEPYTGYTYETVLEALYNADFGIGSEVSGKPGAPEESLMQVFTIDTGYAQGFFVSIAEATGGAYSSVDDASQVADAIQDYIEMVELEPMQSVKVDLGEDFSGERADVYFEGEYQFTIPLDEYGEAYLKDMPIEEFQWKINRLNREGDFEVKEGKKSASVDVDKAGFGNFLSVLWYRERTTMFLWTEAALVAAIVVLLLVGLVMKLVEFIQVRRATAPVRQAAAVAKQQAVPEAAQKATEEKREAYYCTNCGTILAPGDLFCGECGQKVE